MKMSFGILFMIFFLQSCGSISTEYSVDYDHPRFTVVMGGFDELLEETCVKKLKDIQGCNFFNISDDLNKNNRSPECIEKIKKRQYPQVGSDCYKENIYLSHLAIDRIEQCVYEKIDKECKEQLEVANKQLNEHQRKCSEAAKELGPICASNKKDDQNYCRNEGKEKVRIACEKPSRTRK